MSKKEKIKLELDIIKALILACLTAIFGIFGYSVINYKHIDLVQGSCIVAGLVILFVILYILARIVIKDLNKIEEL